MRPDLSGRCSKDTLISSVAMTATNHVQWCFVIITSLQSGSTPFEALASIAHRVVMTPWPTALQS